MLPIVRTIEAPVEAPFFSKILSVLHFSFGYVFTPNIPNPNVEVWSLDFEFRILDCFSPPPLCRSPKRSNLDFGFCIRLLLLQAGLGRWILRYAEPGRHMHASRPESFQKQCHGRS